MEEWQKRVIRENESLLAKLDRLIIFIEDDKFKNLNYKNQRLLKRQKMVMELYSDVLTERIEEF